MTAADFARIKARFPKLRWRHDVDYASMGGRALVLAGVGVFEVSIRPDHETRLFVWTLACDGHYYSEIRRGNPQALGRCLRSLERAILREAKTLAGMVGKEVTL